MHVLHRDIWSRVDDACIEHLDDVGVLAQFGDCLPLVDEPFGGEWVLEFERDRLQRTLALQAAMHGEGHDPHRTAPQFTGNLIRTKRAGHAGECTHITQHTTGNVECCKWATGSSE